MRVEVEEVVVGDARLPGRWSAGVRGDLPLIVAIHGAAYDARYFSATDRSIHDIGVAHGWSVLSITRPGYPAVVGVATEQPTFDHAAGIIAQAIADAWSRWGEGRPGVIVLGHSVGAAVVVHLAARADVDFPLLGVAISGIGDTPDPGAVATFGSMPRNVNLDLNFDLCRPFFYAADGAFDARWIDELADLLVPFPAADVVEVNTDWPRNLPKLAAEVAVPVHYVLAEHDALWIVDEQRVNEFAAMFTRSPHVEARLWREAGHNIEHHLEGEKYVNSVLVFAQRCIGAHP